MKRKLGISLLVVIFLLILGGILGRLFLHSERVAREVSTRLAAVYGSNVQVEKVEVGLGTVSLSGVELFEEQTPGAAPIAWLKVTKLTTDLSLLDLLRGEDMPRHVTLTGVTVLLRFGKGGELLTRLPASITSKAAGPAGLPALPEEIIVQDGIIIIRKEGAADLSAHQLNVSCTDWKDRLHLTGTVEVAGGSLTVDGNLAKGSGLTTVQLKTDGKMHATQSILDSLPFVPAAVCNEIQLKGAEASAGLAVQWNPSKKEFHYELDLAIDHSSFNLPELGLPARNVTVKARAEDSVVRLAEVTGEAFGGTFRAEGTLDFRAGARISVNKIDLAGLDVADLPREWNIPDVMRRAVAKGKLFGTAALELSIATAEPRLHAVTLAALAGPSTAVASGWFSAPALLAIPSGTQIETKSQGKGQIRDPAGKSEPIEFDWQLAPREPRTPKGAAAAEFHADGPELDPTDAETHHLLAVLLMGQTMLIQQEPKEKPKGLPNYTDLDLKLKNVNLAQIVKNLGLKLPVDVGGRVSVQVKVSLPLAKVDDFKAYKVVGSMQTEHLALAGVNVGEVRADFDYSDGTLNVKSLEGRFPAPPGSPRAAAGIIAGSGRAQLVPAGALHADLRIENLPINNLGNLGIDKVQGTISGKLSLRANLDKNLDGVAALEGEGSIDGEQFKIAGVELTKLATTFQLKDGVLQLPDTRAFLYGGQIMGSATLPINSERAGKVDFDIRGLDVARLGKGLRLPFQVAGNVEGSLTGSIPAGKTAIASRALLHLDIKAPSLRVHDIPAERLHGDLEYRSGVLDYKLEGQTLGGTFELEGQIPGLDQLELPKKQGAKQSQLKVHNIRLARLFRELRVQNLESLGGTIDLEIAYTHDTADRLPRGEGLLRISDVRWGNNVIADRLRGQVLVSGEQIRVRELGGNLAQGRVRADVSYVPRQPDRSEFSLNLDGVQIGQLLAPWLEGKAEGALHARVRGSLGSEWRGRADVELAQGKLYGVEVSQWRIPATWSYAPGQNRGQIDVYETTGRVSRGQATGKLSLSWDYTARVEGNVRLIGADLQGLRHAFGSGQFGAGQLNARFDFAGNGVRSLADLTGKLTATIKQAQPLQAPVLSQLAPFLRLNTATTFQSGELLANLDRGVLRVQQLRLQGDTAQLFASGTVSLEERLNLAVIVRTGSVILPSVRLGPFALTIPLAGPVPLVLLEEASNLLSNQVIYLQVGGTVASPVIQPRPVPLLSQEAVRYFLNRGTLPISIAP
jgi:hypothetical protein